MRAHRSRSAWHGRALVAVALVAASARAEPPPRSDERLRTSLVAIFGDDDVLHAPADATPPSPAPGFGDRPGYDGLFAGRSSRYTGRESRSELWLDGSAPGLWRGVDTRARLALALDASSLGVRSAPVLVEDAGSFVELGWTFGARQPDRPDRLALRVLPLNADRERVGTLELLGWGGAVGPRWESPYAAAQGAVHAARLELAAGVAVLHVGLKTARFLEPSPAGPAVAETSYGVYGGVESRFRAPLGVALGFGRFEHGRLPGSGMPPRASTTGAALRLHAGSGFTEPRAPSGFALEPSPFDAATSDGRPDVARGVALSVETCHLIQRLWDYDHPGGSALEPARAVAAVAEWRAGAFELRAAFTLRDPAFVMRNAPGVFGGQTLPRAAPRRDELGGSLGAGVTVAHGARLGLGLGVLSPAALLTQAVDRQGQPIGATLVLRGPSDVEALPPGEVPVPVLELRPSLALRLSALLEAAAWADYRRDFNRTRLLPAPAGAIALGFRSADRLGLGLALRAVW